jgi:NDP-sugar pyrophosphorylase family protein
MKAMVLAAGLGTRLRPLTNDRPKALVDVGGRTTLEITLARLRAFGIREVIINVHHFADMIAGYLKTNHNFGMHIELSHEDVLLDTGGGLKKAAWFFLNDAGGLNTPFVLHNVDVISNVDVRRMAAFHTEHQALATLAVQHREASRYLLFDEQLQLCGRCAGLDKAPEVARNSPRLQRLAFSGIHVISPRLLPMLEDGVFSIISSYVQLAAREQKIVAFQTDDCYWRDLGRPDSIAQAAEDLKERAF